LPRPVQSAYRCLNFSDPSGDTVIVKSAEKDRILEGCKAESACYHAWEVLNASTRNYYVVDITDREDLGLDARAYGPSRDKDDPAPQWAEQMFGRAITGGVITVSSTHVPSGFGGRTSNVAWHEMTHELGREETGRPYGHQPGHTDGAFCGVPIGNTNHYLERIPCPR